MKSVTFLLFFRNRSGVSLLVSHCWLCITLHHFCSFGVKISTRRQFCFSNGQLYWVNVRRTPLGLLLSDLCHSPSSILDPLQSIFSKAEELAAGMADDGSSRFFWWISWGGKSLISGGNWETSLGLPWIGQIEPVCAEFYQCNSVQCFNMFYPSKRV